VVDALDVLAEAIVAFAQCRGGIAIPNADLTETP
jgi:hypothetical protein